MWREVGTFLFLFFIGVALASEEQHQQQQEELGVIAQLESSSGKNLNHPVVESGMHKGHRASGRYGLMPLTVRDLVSKNRPLREKYGYLLSLSHYEVTEEINTNKEMDKDIALFFWKQLRKAFGPRRSAYAWYFGPAKAKTVEQSQMEQTPYVVKFTKEMERLKNEREIQR
jgi:hypothetical protein